MMIVEEEEVKVMADGLEIQKDIQRQHEIEVVAGAEVVLQEMKITTMTMMKMIVEEEEVKAMADGLEIQKAIQRWQAAEIIVWEEEIVLQEMKITMKMMIIMTAV